MTAHIIKRRGHKEQYDERKIYASVYNACLNSHLHVTQAEKIAGKVSLGITRWISENQITRSEDIFKKTIELLKPENKDVAFMYETHRDLS